MQKVGGSNRGKNVAQGERGAQRPRARHYCLLYGGAPSTISNVCWLAWYKRNGEGGEADHRHLPAARIGGNVAPGVMADTTRIDDMKEIERR